MKNWAKNISKTNRLLFYNQFNQIRKMKFKILTTAALFSSATFVTAEKPIPKMLQRIIPDHLSDNERDTFIQKVESISKRFQVKEKRRHPHIMV